MFIDLGQLLFGAAVLTTTVWRQCRDWNMCLMKMGHDGRAMKKWMKV